MVCDLSSLAVGASATIDISGTIAAGTGQITNTVTVAGDNLDRFPSNNTANAVTALNNPPTAVGQAVSTPTNTPIAASALTGATDLDGNTVVLFAAGPASNGVVVVNADGTVTYTPNAGYTGPDSFEFTLSDGRGGFGTATVDITVDNAPPVANPDTVATPGNTAITIPVLDNDTDLNGDALTVVAGSATVPANGTATINADDTITYIPDPTFRGTDTFDYTITDGLSTSTATVTIIVPDIAPIAIPDFATLDPNTVTSIDIPVLGNDVDDNGDTLTVVPGSATVPANGTAAINANGTITYTPTPGFEGPDTFDYTITDGTETSTTTVTVTVLNTIPTATNNTANTPPATPVTIDVVGDDTDPNPTDLLTVIGIGTPTNGTAVLNPDGTITYTPNPGFKGSDTFDYTMTDGTDTATATITITVEDAPPVANSDSRTTPTNTPVTVPVTANDFDPNGDALIVTAVTTPSNGTATINADGTITYTPNDGYKGPDSFTYTITDGISTATATATITVLNAPPIAMPDTESTSIGTAITVPALDNDTDPNGDVLTIVPGSVSSPARGIAVLNPNGTITYTPDAGFTGTDTIIYTVTDGTETSTTTITITVTATPTTATTTTTPPATTTPATPTTPTAPTTPATPPTPTTTPSVPVPDLPATGSSSLRTMWIALIIIAGGIVLAATARRRHAP